MADVTVLRGAVMGPGYRLGRPLGDGGNAVFQATHERLLGHYVVRLFRAETLTRPDAPARILRALGTASLLRDARVVQLLDFAVSGETPAFAVMEKVEGQSLAALMSEHGILPAGRVVDLVESLAAALEAGHRLGLVHGDLRPAHVLLPRGPAGHAPLKLAGFGWAKELRAAAKRPAPSGYLAPEQHFGKEVKVDARADQFALVALAYELIAGCLPFSEESAELADKPGARRVPPPIAELVPGVPAAVDGVLRRGLAPEPRERFADVMELARHLRAAVGLGPQSLPLPPRAAAVPAPAAAAPAAQPRRRRLESTEELDIGDADLDLGDDRVDQADDEDEDSDRTLTNQREDAPASLRLSLVARHLTPPRRPGAQAADAFFVEPADDDAGDEDDDAGNEDITRTGGGTRASSIRPRAPAARAGTGAAGADDGKTIITRSPFVVTDDGTLPNAAAPVGGDDDDSDVDAMLEDAPSGRAAGPGRSGRTAIPPGGGNWSPRRSGPVVLSAPPTTASGRVVVSPDTAPGAPAPSGIRATWIYAGVAVLALVIAGFAVKARSSHTATSDTAAAPSAPAPAAAAPPSERPPAAAPVVAAVPEAPVPPAAAPAATGAPAGGAAAAPAGAAAPAVAPLAAAPAAAAPAAAAQAEPPRPPEPPPPPTAGRAVGAGGSRRSQAKLRAARGPATSRAAPAPSPPAPASRSAAGASAAAPSSGGSGDCVLQIGSHPWAQVWLDGRNTGLKTPVASYRIPCGAHKLQLKRPDRDIEQMEMVRVERGVPFRRVYELE